MAFLTACGGGASGTATTTPGAAVSQSYYPAISGARWSYDVTNNNPSSSYINDVVVSGTKAVSGVNAWAFQESNPAEDGVAVENYYSKDAVAFRYLSDNSTANCLTAAASSFDMMRFDGTFGATGHETS